MKHPKNNAGFTLIELMVTVAIMAVLVGIAIPAYNSYVETGCLATAGTNLQTLRSFEENYRIETDSYLAGAFNAGDDPATNALARGLHWKPDDNDQFSYTVAAGATGIASSYNITVSGVAACAGTVLNVTGP